MTNASKSPLERVSPLVRDLPRSGIRAFFDIVATRDDVISLGIGEPDFVTPWHIREAAISSIERGATHYTSNLGLADLRKAICRYVARSYPGLSYDWRTETLVTVGVSEALDAIVRAVVEPGDEVLFHEPCFVAYASIVRLAHGVPVPVETRADNGFKLTREALEAAVTPRTKALLVNFPCNPTGAVLDEASAKMIVDFVSRCASPPSVNSISPPRSLGSSGFEPMKPMSSSESSWQCSPKMGSRSGTAEYQAVFIWNAPGTTLPSIQQMRWANLS